MDQNQNSLPEGAISEIRATTTLMLVFAILSALGTLIGLKGTFTLVSVAPLSGILALAQTGLSVYALVLLFQSWQAFQNYLSQKDGGMLHQAMKYTSMYWKIQTIVLFVAIGVGLINGVTGAARF